MCEVQNMVSYILYRQSPITVNYVFVYFQATDDDGAGQMTVVSLQISLTDSNDNPPVFATQVYKASIDEDAVKFEPELQVKNTFR